MIERPVCTTKLRCKLRSTRTNNILWRYKGAVVVDLGGRSGNVFVDIIVSAVNPAMAEYVDAAKRVNNFTFSTLPEGPYSQAYMNDQEAVIFDQGALDSTK
ncbi:hypothetical protein [Halodesulfovibrio aestuarii]|uniref:Uncharacterized protein n=1 Tax=Halodesulfovibrio aestuarii TaxID=126333 RepID=A0ABV4JTG3_9BACT